MQAPAQPLYSLEALTQFYPRIVSPGHSARRGLILTVEEGLQARKGLLGRELLTEMVLAQSHPLWLETVLRSSLFVIEPRGSLSPYGFSCHGLYLIELMIL